jgi:hypothetical protein
VLALGTSCKSGAPKAEASAEHAAKPQTPAPATSARQAFGAPLGSSPRAELSKILEQPERFENKSVMVEGHVKRACSRKGCWMELSSADAPGGASCRVTFKDYGFFVPTDAAGSKARLEATVQSTLVKASHVAHLEEEGAKFSSKAPDGSAREVRLVATGVELER